MKNHNEYPRRFCGSLTREDSRTCRRFEFFVPPGVSQVVVKLTYEPQHQGSGEILSADEFRKRWCREIRHHRAKVELAGDPALIAYYERFVDEAIPRMQPLYNLLNLAVFDSAGAFRGRWDSPQHFGRWVSIGETEATRGFVSGPIPPGEWTIILECHAVVTDACEYELEVGCMAAEGWWYKGELHAHTDHSDGRMSPDELVAAAAEARLDFIVITDHNTISGLAAMSEMPSSTRLVSSGSSVASGPSAEEKPPMLLVIPGVELTTFHGHAVAIGVSAFIPWHDAPRDEGLKHQAEEVHRQGGIFSIAHPFSVGYPACAGCEWEYENVDPTVVDLMEVWSGPWTSHILWNILAMRWWDELLCRGYHVTGVAARDVHRREEFFQRETADTYVWARSLTPAAIIEGLKAGRVYLSSGPVLDFSARLSDDRTRYLPGDRMRVREGEKVDFAVEVGGVNESGAEDLEVRVVRGTMGGGAYPVWKVRPDSKGRVWFQDTVEREAWYRCEVTSTRKPYLPGPHLLALSNPIHVEVIPCEDC